MKRYTKRNKRKTKLNRFRKRRESDKVRDSNTNKKVKKYNKNNDKNTGVNLMKIQRYCPYRKRKVEEYWGYDICDKDGKQLLEEHPPLCNVNISCKKHVTDLGIHVDPIIIPPAKEDIGIGDKFRCNNGEIYEIKEGSYLYDFAIVDKHDNIITELNEIHLDSIIHGSDYRFSVGIDESGELIYTDIVEIL